MNRKLSNDEFRNAVFSLDLDQYTCVFKEY